MLCARRAAQNLAVKIVIKDVGFGATYCKFDPLYRPVFTEWISEMNSDIVLNQYCSIDMIQ